MLDLALGKKIVGLQLEWYGNQILLMLPKRRKMSS